MSLEWENDMNRKDLVAVFMESPFYFDLMLQERLELLQEHENRLATRRWDKSKYLFEITAYRHNNDAHVVTKITVGYFPPAESANCNL